MYVSFSCETFSLCQVSPLCKRALTALPYTPFKWECMKKSIAYVLSEDRCILQWFPETCLSLILQNEVLCDFNPQRYDEQIAEPDVFLLFNNTHLSCCFTLLVCSGFSSVTDAGWLSHMGEQILKTVLEPQSLSTFPSQFLLFLAERTNMEMFEN